MSKNLLEFSMEELVHKMGNIQPANLGSINGMSINLTWNQLIRATNYAAKETVLTWKDTAYEGIIKFARFLAKGKPLENDSQANVES